LTANVFEDALTRIRACANTTGVSEEVIESLMHPMALLRASLPVRMDDGSMRYFTGYRCRYNSTLGPTKGDASRSSSAMATS